MPRVNYLRDRSEQLANFLRDGILNGEYPPPLPPTRVWCQQLGVGRPTLLRALQVLDSEGLIMMTKRGALLASSKHVPQVSADTNQKIVRILTCGISEGYFDLEIIHLVEQLQLHGIRLVVESCNLSRLKKIASQKERPWELCCLLSVPGNYQKYFLPRKNSTLVMGFGTPGISLPFLTPDLYGSTRHATNTLLRRGFKHLVMLEQSSKAAGVAQCVHAFKTACEDWRAQPIRAEVQTIWNDFTSMRTAITRTVKKLRSPCGILIHAPISVGVLVTTLLQKGFEIPAQASIMALEYRKAEVQFSVPVTHYEVPTERYSKEVLHSALHYFETGRLPDVHKVLPMDVATHG